MGEWLPYCRSASPYGEYRFKEDTTASLERCVDGSWEVAEHDWALTGGGEDLFTLRLGERDYLATLVEKGDLLELTLITLAPEKDQATVKETLSYALD